MKCPFSKKGRMNVTVFLVVRVIIPAIPAGTYSVPAFAAGLLGNGDVRQHCHRDDQQQQERNFHRCAFYPLAVGNREIVSRAKGRLRQLEGNLSVFYRRDIRSKRLKTSHIGRNILSNPISPVIILWTNWSTGSNLAPSSTHHCAP
jgi:hypothetical protein